MRELLKRDITVRIISVVFALILWFFVLNSNNPMDVRIISVSLEVKNEQTLQDKNIEWKNKNIAKTVEVMVKGRKEKISGLTANDFTAALDLSKIQSADEDKLAIDGPYYVGKEEVEIRGINPREIKLDLEKKEKNPFKVEIVPTGKLKDNYKIIKSVAVPDIVSLEGLDSLIKSVASIKTFVDVNNLDRDLVINKKECKVYNKKGEEIKELSKNLYVEVRVEVAKEVPVVPVVKGKPAKDYIDGLKRVKPDKVLVTGTPEVLSKLTQLQTEAVDIENSSASMDITRNIILPQGIRLVNSSPEVAVSVAIEQLVVKEFTILKEDISFVNTEIDNSLNYSMVNDFMKISIKANSADLDKLDASMLNPTVDVAKLGEGTHKLPLQIDLPANAKLIEEYTVEIKVEKR